MEICADMLGSPDESKKAVYGFTPGLNETESEARLRERIKNIEQGIFQVMFTGTFDSGKSTLLNALMRTDVLATGILPETAVITKIIFKAEEEYVVIYKKEQDKNNQPVTIAMKNIAEFFKEYRFDPEDEEKFRRLVNHVVIYQKSGGIAGSMVQLVDSPGTWASQADDEVALDFAEKADALVFMINAIQPLDKHDKKYIAEHFAGKQKENVFFVVNKINLLNTNAAVKSLKEYVQKELQDVFTDKNGTFNQGLYEKRVFYVDAFGSMNTRMGRKTPVARNYKVMIPDDTTGIPEFEASLGAFLTSGDRDKATLSAYRGQMADFYMLAEESMKNQLEILKKSIDEVKAEWDDLEKEKRKINREIQDISDEIEITRHDILRDARDVFEDYFNAVENDWRGYFDGKSGEMKVLMRKLLPIRMQYITLFMFFPWTWIREIKNITAYFSDCINEFMKIKKDEMAEQFRIRLNSRIKELMERLDRHQENLARMRIPIDINEVVKMISCEYNVNVPDMDDNNARFGQALTVILLADLQADYELVVTADIIDFLMDVITDNVIEMILSPIIISILDNVLGNISFVFTRILQGGLEENRITEAMITELMNMIINGGIDTEGNTIESLRKEGKIKYIASVENRIGGAMRRANHILTESMKERFFAIKRQLVEAYDTLTANENALETETERMNHILDTFAKAVSDLSVLTSRTSLSVDDIRENNR